MPTHDRLTPEQRHRNMQAIRSVNTSIELMLRRALWHKGYRYRKNWKALPGKPDIVLTKYKIAIFCDSEFFHGQCWDSLKPQLERGKNSEYWINKITRNRQRDQENEIALNAMGWTVLRFWGRDILKDVDDCVRTIEETILELRSLEAGQVAEEEVPYGVETE